MAAASGAFCDGPRPVADFMWLSVLRTAPSRNGLCDGRCPGYDAKEARKPAYDAIIPNSSRWARVNYGCWFYTALNASAHSGAFVNVGRSLRLETRCDVHDVLYKSRQSSNSLCTTNLGDKLWCTLARAQGYDSIQIQRGISYHNNSMKRRPWGELIHCGEECARQTFSESACVPVAVAANNAECRCPSGAGQLSCGGEEQLPPAWPPATVSSRSAAARLEAEQPARCHAAPSFAHKELLRANDARTGRQPRSGSKASG